VHASEQLAVAQADLEQARAGNLSAVSVQELISHASLAARHASSELEALAFSFEQ
jgi:hypothetical protein